MLLKKLALADLAYHQQSPYSTDRHCMPSPLHLLYSLSSAGLMHSCIAFSIAFKFISRLNAFVILSNDSSFHQQTPVFQVISVFLLSLSFMIRNLLALLSFSLQHQTLCISIQPHTAISHNHLKVTICCKPSTDRQTGHRFNQPKMQRLFVRKLIKRYVELQYTNRYTDR